MYVFKSLWIHVTHDMDKMTRYSSSKAIPKQTKSLGTQARTTLNSMPAANLHLYEKITIKTDHHC